MKRMYVYMSKQEKRGIVYSFDGKRKRQEP